MRFYEKTPCKGILFYKKKFAWLPTNVRTTTVWLEYYWERHEWSEWYKDYFKSPWGLNHKLLEEHNEHS